MRPDDITAAIDRIWTVCTAGTTHPALWIVWLRGVCSSHAQKLWSDCVRIGFIRALPKRFSQRVYTTAARTLFCRLVRRGVLQTGRVSPMTRAARIVDVSSRDKERVDFSGLGGLERPAGGGDQSTRRGHPFLAVSGAPLHQQPVPRLRDHRSTGA